MKQFSLQTTGPARTRNTTIRAAAISLWVSVGAHTGSCARPQYVSQDHAGLQTPVPIGDGDTGKPALDATVRPSSSAATGRGSSSADEKRHIGPSARVLAAGLPDPATQPTSVVFEVLLRYCDQSVHWLGTRRVESERASTLPTRMGRFAIELGIGHELLERARFDFPLLGAEPQGEEGLRSTPQFAPKADVSRIIRVAERPRATWARIVDRATGEIWPMRWPLPEVSAEPLPLAALSERPCPSQPELRSIEPAGTESSDTDSRRFQGQE